MLEAIISILNTKLLLTNYFRDLYGLGELKTINKKSAPYVYCGKGEWKHLTKFDTTNGMSYWRKTGSETVSESNNGSLISNKKIISMTIPLRLVAVTRRELMTTDSPYTANILAKSLAAVLATDVSATLKQSLGIKKLTVSITNINDNQSEVITEELKGNQTDLVSKLVAVAINLNVNLEVYEGCLDTECDLNTTCEALLALLTSEQKIDCILPTYDFTDADTLAALTAQQELDLQSALCAVTTATVRNSDSSYNTTVDGGDTLILPDITVTTKNSANTTIDTTVSPSVKNVTVNISDSNVSNSDDSYTQNVPAETNLELPDITVTAPNGGTASYPSVKNYACTQIAALANSDLISQLTDAQVQALVAGRINQRVVQLTNTAGGTYTTPSDLLYAFVVCIGGGGGGGSGRRGLTSSNRCGGAGGACGTMARRWLTRSDLGVSQAWTIGTGGAGGTAPVADSTSGNNGSAGNNTTFGSLVVAIGGNGGSLGGTSTTSAGATATTLSLMTPTQFPLSHRNGTGGAGGTTAGAAAATTGFDNVLGNNGAGGGGVGTTNTQAAGGLGSRSFDNTGVLNSGATAGTTGGGTGGNGTANQSLQVHFDYISGTPLNTIGFGTSGGGGGGNSGGGGGIGGDGAVYGAAGAGAGGGTNGATGGKGGDGAQGCIIIFEYYV